MNAAVRANDYPALRHLFGAYLNRDWPQEYGSIECALDAYRDETPLERRTEAAAQIRSLLGRGFSDGDLARAAFDLGLEYAFEPPNDDAAAFLASAAERITR